MDPRRSIPSTDRLLASRAFRGLAADVPRTLLLDSLQAVQQAERDRLSAAAANGSSSDASTEEQTAEWYAARVTQHIDSLRASTLRPVINATGVVLHTNLGRAPLATAAIQAIARAAGGYVTLEYDAARGRRGSRHDHCTRLFRQITGAEDALVVNNTAAALVLALNTLARRRQVIVSRGELVEIGGSFRVPDIMARSGATMVEVGTTNRTSIDDYRTAAGSRTAALLRVHRSNFRIEGFTAEPSLASLAELARSLDVPLLHDLGSGLVHDGAALGLPDEPTVQSVLGSGADIVAISGDKLLGGPQAGILLGRADLLSAMRRNPLCRALRVDKLTLAALEATLQLHLDPAIAFREIPVLRMLSEQPAVLKARSTKLAAVLAAAGCGASVIEGESAVGGGAAPGQALPAALIRVTPGRVKASTLERRLRAHARPVIARIIDDAVVLDLRTVDPADDDALAAAVCAAADRDVA